jgi:hypothetical protein
MWFRRQNCRILQRGAPATRRVSEPVAQFDRAFWANPHLIRRSASCRAWLLRPRKSDMVAADVIGMTASMNAKISAGNTPNSIAGSTSQIDSAIEKAARRGRTKIATGRRVPPD